MSEQPPIINDDNRDPLNDPSSETPLLASPFNWLHQTVDALTNNSEKILLQKLQIIHECKQRVLDKYFGKVIPLERVMHMKQKIAHLLDEAEKTLPVSASGSISHYLYVPGDTNDAGYQRVELRRNTHRDTTMQSRDEVRLKNIFVKEAVELPEGDPYFPYVHDHIYIQAGAENAIWLDRAQLSTQPYVNITDIPRANIVSVEQQLAALEGRPIPPLPGSKTMQNMFEEYLQECMSNGITREDMENLQAHEFPDPADPENMISGSSLIQFSTRELRNNLDDLYNIAVIEQALELGLTHFNHGKFLEERAKAMRKTLLDFEKPNPDTEIIQKIAESIKHMLRGVDDDKHVFSLDEIIAAVQSALPNITQDVIINAIITTNYALQDIDYVIFPQYPNGKKFSSVANRLFSWGRHKKDIFREKKSWTPILLCAAEILPHTFKFDYSMEPREQPIYRLDLSVVNDELLQKLRKILENVPQ